MTYRLLYKLLHDSANISHRVGTGIFAENAPAGTQGACIIIRILSGTADQHMGGESDCAMPMVQLDAYEETATKAESLYQLIRNRISGYRGDVDVLNEVGVEEVVSVHEIALRRPGMLASEPRDASDKWTYRFTADFEVFHSQSVPTLV